MVYSYQMQFDFTFSNSVLIAQFIGFISLVFGLLAFTHKNDGKLKIFMTLQSLTLALHYFLIGAITASAMSSVSGVRNFMSIFKKLKMLAPLFIILYIGFAYYTYQSAVDLLTPVASCLSTFAYFYTEGLLLRVLLLIVSFLWLLNNIFFMSLGPAVMEMFLVSVNMITIFRIMTEEE